MKRLERDEQRVAGAWLLAYALQWFAPSIRPAVPALFAAFGLWLSVRRPPSSAGRGWTSLALVVGSGGLLVAGLRLGGEARVSLVLVGVGALIGVLAGRVFGGTREPTAGLTLLVVALGLPLAADSVLRASESPGTATAITIALGVVALAAGVAWLTIRRNVASRSERGGNAYVGSTGPRKRDR